MVEPIGDWPDFTRAILIVGKDADGNPIGVYVDGSGYLGAVLKAAADVNVQGSVPVDQNAKDREFQGSDGATLRTVAVDASGQIIMVPRGASGEYMLVDANGYLMARLVAARQGGGLAEVAVDANGQMIMVPRGQSGNYMSIDASGYMTAVLKGAHDSTLTTIGVDSNGRIDAFLMDGTDQWSKQIRVGNADLAARLGSPCTHDWRGQVLWANTFGAGLGTIKTMAIGTGAAVTIDPEYSLLDGYSLKMKGGSDSDRFALAYGYLGKPPGGRIGISVAVAGYVEATSIALRARAGGTRYMGTLRYTWATNRLEYQNSGGGYTFEATKVLYGSTSIFNLLKVVIDTSTHYYARFLVNDTAYILTGDALYSDAGGFDGTMEFEIKVTSRAGLNDYQLIDRIIITNNEP